MINTTKRTIIQRRLASWMLAGWIGLTLATAGASAVGQVFESQKIGEAVEGPLIDRKPFDMIYLDNKNRNAAIKIAPLRNPPSKPYPREGLLVFEFHDDDEVQLQVPYANVVDYKTFNQLLIDEANQWLSGSEYPKAFRNLLYVYDHGGKNNPEIRKSLEECLFQDGKNNFVTGRFELALSIYEDIYKKNPSFKVKGINKTLIDIIMACYDGVLDKKFENQQYQSVRESINVITEKYGDESKKFQARWNKRFIQKSDELMAVANRLMQGEDGKLAHQAARRAINIFPERPEAEALQERIIKKFPLVFVATSQDAGQADPLRIDHWGSRRVGRLTQRTIIEFMGLSDEGGQYKFLNGKIQQVDQAGLEFRFTIEPTSDRVPQVTPFQLSERIRALADENSPEYKLAWAKVFKKIEIEKNSVLIHLRFPFVRPEALLTMPYNNPEGEGDRVQNGPYFLTSTDGEFSLFEPNPIFDAVPDRQNPLLIEQQFKTASEAVQALIKGDVDVVDRIPLSDVEKLRIHPKIRVQPYIVPTVHYLVPNVRNEFTSDTNFRLGLIRGLDREIILNEAICGGKPRDGCEVISGPFPIGSDDNDQISYGYNMKVRAMPYNNRLGMVLVRVAQSIKVDRLRAKGEANPKVEIPPIVLAYPDTQTATLAVASIHRMWTEMNLDVRLRKIEPGETAPADTDWDFLYVEAQIQEPLTDAAKIIGEDGFAKSTNATIDLSLRRLSQSGNWRGSCQRLRELHRQVANDVSLIPLYQVREYYAHRRNLKNMGRNLVHLYENVERWQIDSSMDEEK